MHHNEVELKARNVAHHSWESEHILNGEQPEAVEDSKVYWTIPDASQEFIQQLLYRNEIRAY